MNSTIFKKRCMAAIGIFWLIYLFFHMLSLLNFYNGKESFNGFFAWLDSTMFYIILFIVLVVTLVFHVFVAVSRQVDNSKCVKIKYYKPYPKAVPRLVAWGGASILLAFIVFHVVQMTILDDEDIYQQMLSVFAHPLMWIIYILGLLTLGAHLHHGLTNVLQTFGLSYKQYDIIVLSIVSILIIGFISVPISIVL